MARKNKTFDAFDLESGDALATIVGNEQAITPLATGKIANKFPLFKNQPYKIAIIGDYPHRADAFHLTPFASQGTPDYPYSGTAGSMLNVRLSQASIARDACFLGHVCQYTGLDKLVDKCDFGSAEIQSSIDTLKADLDEFNPNICVLLGIPALFLAKGDKKIDSWRGSIFICDIPGPFFGRKCITSYHPHYCLRQYSNFALLSFDLRRAAAQARTPEFIPPQRNLIASHSYDQILSELQKVKQTKPTIAIDIEGYVDAMSCISIATSETFSFIVPLASKSNDNIWSEDQEVELWRALSAVLEDQEIPKVLQNSLYDRFVLQYSYGLVVRNIKEDTMLKHWELYCEFEKNLGFQCSIYTEEPYYKQDRKTQDLETFYRYCCRDSAVTLEISNKLDKFLSGQRKTHYQFNVDLLNPLLYMENRGILYDSIAAKNALIQVESHLVALQSELDTLAGVGIPPYTSLPELLVKIQSVMCYVRDSSQPKKDYVEIYPRIRQMLADAHQTNTPLTPAQLTYISVECDFSMNIKSPMFKTLLYEKLKLPVQYKIDKETKERKITADYAALLKLQKLQPTRVVELAIQIGLLRTRSQMLHINADSDNRVRCGYNIVGTETGRLTCYTSPTGSGYNLQTIPSEDSTKPESHPLREGMRHLFKADPGFYMFQCDLAGADGWTVAAHCANLGDRTLLDDYLTGIKPAKVLCYMLRHGAGSLNGKTRAEIKELTKEVKKEDWDYFACKCGQHGSCYLMGPQLLADLIFTQSEGTISLSVAETKELQALFFIRYRVKLWHEWMGRMLKASPVIKTINGYERRFYGRPTEILGQALAHEPQAVTTYATNLAMWKLWSDGDNRQLVGNRTTLRIEPLHQVHDALVGQFRIEDTDWAIGKIKSYFNNKLTIANQPIIIPFEGNYGESWGNLTQGNI